MPKPFLLPPLCSKGMVGPDEVVSLVDAVEVRDISDLGLAVPGRLLASSSVVTMSSSSGMGCASRHPNGSTEVVRAKWRTLRKTLY